MRRIQVYDTTLRDGAQGEGISFSLEDKLLLTRRLGSLGFDYVEGGYPASNPKDAEYFQRIAQEGLGAGDWGLGDAEQGASVRGLKPRVPNPPSPVPRPRVRVCAFGMTRRKGTAVQEDEGVAALLAAGTPTVSVVGKASAFQATEVLHTTQEENLKMIAETVAHLRAAGREVIFDAEHFFDGWKANPRYTLKSIQAAADAGAMLVVLCDTNGGSMPEEVARITREVAGQLSVPLGIHCHNDCGLAVANSLAAVDAGAVQVQGTINGFGERCGNTDLLAVIANLALKKGYDVLDAESVRHLTELSRYVYEMVNMNYPPRQPFVGRSAFTHKGGMHVSGVARAVASYEHIDPQAVGNERRILVSELSGRSTIVAMTAKHNIQHDRKLMDKILSKVVAKEHAGYQFEAAEGSFDLLVRQCMGTFKPHFELLHFRVNVEAKAEGRRQRAEGRLEREAPGMSKLSGEASAAPTPPSALSALPSSPVTTEATIKVRVGDQIRHEVAEGDGPVNALDAAMRKALNGCFPALRAMHLVDYKVRVINSEAGTAAGVRVVIESRDAEEVWGTVGVSENIIEASWIALADSYEYKLCKEEKGK